MNELPLIRPVQPKVPATTAGFALWNLGFRPFYLFGAAPLMIASIKGYLDVRTATKGTVAHSG